MNNSLNQATTLQKQHNVVTHAHPLQTQPQQQHLQNIATMQNQAANLLQTSPPPPPPAGSIISYIQPPQMHHHHHQLNQLSAQQQQYTPIATPMGSTHSAATTFLDARQLQTTTGLDKASPTATFYASNPGDATNAARFCNAAAQQQATAAAVHHPNNTILITNNFTQQPLPTLQQHQRTAAVIGSAVGYNNNNTNNNIRFLSTTPNTVSSLPQNAHQQHVYNINNNGLVGKDMHATADAASLHQQLYQQQSPTTLLQQVQQQPHHLSALIPQHSAQLAPTHYAQQHYTATSPTSSLHQQQQHTLPLQLTLPAQQYYIPAAENAETTLTGGIMTSSSAAAGPAGNMVNPLTANTVTASSSSLAAPVPSSNSTVVLDRINICINNHHYSDVMTSSSSNGCGADATGGVIGLGAGSINTVTSALSTIPAQQPSPIIPAIQHKPIIDSGCIGGGGGLIIDTYLSHNSNDSALVIDEPDSTTTTPHTPPTTPENSSPLQTASTAVQSPSMTTTTTTTSATPRHSHSFLAVARVIEEDVAGDAFTAAAAAKPDIIEIEDDIIITTNDMPIIVQEQEVHQQQQPAAQQEQCILKFPEYQQQQKQTHHTEIVSTIQQPEPSPASSATPLTPPTPVTLSPPSPPIIVSTVVVPAPIKFSMGEDVFIKRQDERFYLGTVIDSARQQYLIRFDDKSEIWCTADEMRKLGGSSSGSSNGSSNNDNSKSAGQMCVACKRAQHDDVVEICERCGRGYHRNCTTETAPGSNEWLCKRCAKPMKVLKTTANSKTDPVYKRSVCRQLPYHVDTLNWDEKHRVNEEQIYCYCGKSGKFDHNMLQCCKCKNWFHTHCMQEFKSNILRGDGFFVFCCTVCNDGLEFLRRLQMNWVDLMHLTLYNLSAMKKHQHHKYHHLIKDIWPFILEKRHTLPIAKKWIEMSESDFKEKIKYTLKHNSDRFVCGREIKKDHYCYGLRNNGPPILPKFTVHTTAELNDKLIVDHLKLNLLEGAPENELSSTINNNKAAYNNNSLQAKQCDNTFNVKDIYEFRIEDDEKFTSDDEIPIKHIIDQAKKNNGAETKTAVKHNAKAGGKKYRSLSLDKMNIDDENANDANCTSSHHANTNTTPTAITPLSILKSPPKTDKKNQQTPKKDFISSSSYNTNSGKSNDDVDSVVVKSVTTVVAEKNSRKRKAFTLSKSYKDIAAEAAAKRYDSSRICDSSSDENSSSSRGTSLDLIIPPPKNFLGSNHPFRMVTPKKSSNHSGGGGSSSKKSVNFGCGFGTMIKNSIFNTNALDFSSKLAALKSAGMFPNLSTSNLAKAAGQPRTVRTIKRRLSAKDITIGPNQEVRRRRTRRLSANVEVISTTTINPIPSNFFPIHAKDLLTPTLYATNHKLLLQQQQQQQQQNINHTSLAVVSTATLSSSSSSASSVDSLPTAIAQAQATDVNTATTSIIAKPTHGRYLRQRPQKNSPSNSRRSSISGASTSSSHSSSNCSTAGVAVGGGVAATSTLPATGSSDTIMQDLKQSVNKYFGAANRIESGEQFSIRAKRQLANGQKQYLIEWGSAGDTTTLPNVSSMNSNNNSNNENNTIVF